MVRILIDQDANNVVVQTTALDHAAFVLELGEAIAQISHEARGDSRFADEDSMSILMMDVLKNAMPIAFKLAGYKAENVHEQRTLVCGHVSPIKCTELASAGR